MWLISRLSCQSFFTQCMYLANTFYCQTEPICFMLLITEPLPRDSNSWRQWRLSKEIVLPTWSWGTGSGGDCLLKWVTAISKSLLSFPKEMKCTWYQGTSCQAHSLFQSPLQLVSRASLVSTKLGVRDTLDSSIMSLTLKVVLAWEENSLVKQKCTKDFACLEIFFNYHKMK